MEQGHKRPRLCIAEAELLRQVGQDDVKRRQNPMSRTMACSDQQRRSILAPIPVPLSVECLSHRYLGRLCPLMAELRCLKSLLGTPADKELMFTFHDEITALVVDRCA